MSTLYLVRHGQASFGTDNYDRLSAIGEEQARELGRYFVASGERIDHIKSEIMPGARITRSRIAQPNDDIHVRVQAPDCE